MSKAKKRKRYQRSNISFFCFNLFLFFLGCLIGLFLLITSVVMLFEKQYQNKIYPGIKIEGIDFSAKTKTEVENFFMDKGKKFDSLTITFFYQEPLATVSGQQLELGYNGKLLAEQAFLLGRSGNFFSDWYLKVKAVKNGVELPLSLYLNDVKLERFLDDFGKKIDILPVDALFRFESGRVVAFRLSKDGRQFKKLKTKEKFYNLLSSLNQKNSFPKSLIVLLSVETVNPKVTTEQANNLGIAELIGSGTSLFYHSSANRVYNITLAATRLNGILIAPAATFSFNKALGDVSQYTGYKQAYIIKEGKTILGDGGGVCQVSTTLFRAALNSGLPIVERWPHSYRVGYYEQDSPPGLDATVYDPINDLKIKNDTSAYILIQTEVDKTSSRLTFKLYGQKDGRKAMITKPVVWDQTPPPPDLYQDDPSLPKGEIKQIDFSAWGAKTSFDYKVEKNDQVIWQKTFYSSYRPWQAVYLRGTRE